MFLEMLTAFGLTSTPSNKFPEVKVSDPRTAYEYLKKVERERKLENFSEKEAFLNHIGSVNIEDGQKNTMLSYAIVDATKDGSNEYIVKWLCYHGADVNKKGTCLKFSPLHYSLLNNQETIASILLDYGADPNEKLEDTTLLHYAIDKGFYVIVKKFFEKSIKHIISGNEVNALFETSIRHEQINTIKLFIESGFVITDAHLHYINDHVDKCSQKDVVTEKLYAIQKLCQESFSKSGAGDTIAQPSS